MPVNERPSTVCHLLRAVVAALFLSALVEGCAPAPPSGEGVTSGLVSGEDIQVAALDNTRCVIHKTALVSNEGWEQFEIRCPGWDNPAGFIVRLGMDMSVPLEAAAMTALASERLPARARLALACGGSTHAFTLVDREPAWLQSSGASGVATTWQAELELARIDAALGQRDEAWRFFEAVVEAARREPLGQNRLQAGDLSPYLQFLDADSRAGSPAAAQTAFAAIELVQSSTTSDALRAMAARFATAMPGLSDEVRRLQDARRTLELARADLTREEYRPDNERNEARLQDLRRVAERVGAQYDALEAELQSRFHAYGRLISHKAPSARDLARLLHPDEALIEIEASEGAIWTFLLRADGSVLMTKSPMSARDVAARVRRVRASVSAGDGATPFDLQAAAELYQAAFAPVEPGLSGVGHLFVIATNAMANLPPQLLVRSAPTAGGTDYAATDWLISHMAVSVLPSAGSLDDLRTVASRTAAPQPSLGVGDPKLQDGPPSSVAAAAVACRDPFLSDTSVLRGLPNLPETADELRTIAHTLHASADDLLLGAHATKPNVSHLPLDRYRVIEFATHALLPREIPCQNEPAIVLTPPLQGSAADDGLLSSGDIAALRLNAEWVILSACNTAGPDGSLRGEALLGLTRAFLYAGARSVLASLWTVASVPTVRLTTETLAQLQAHAGMTRAEALRQTELGMIATPKLSHPAFWAPFVLVGDGGRTAI